MFAAAIPALKIVCDFVVAITLKFQQNMDVLVTIISYQCLRIFSQLLNKMRTHHYAKFFPVLSTSHKHQVQPIATQKNDD